MTHTILTWMLYAAAIAYGVSLPFAAWLVREAGRTRRTVPREPSAPVDWSGYRPLDR